MGLAQNRLVPIPNAGLNLSGLKTGLEPSERIACDGIR